ncbi:MAG: hypothetical protein IT318_18225 [Anaerolineales bacterium]|nr:hypothetical protein [Anaerolineales bacterium]
MFPTPTSVDGRLAEAVAALEAADPAQRVLAARVFRLPFARLRARVALQQPRRFNILEEFVIRAAAELSPPPTPPELAALLGLDPLFIDGTLTQLEQLKAVTRGPQSAVTLTPQGRQFAAQGQVLRPAEHKPLSFLYRGAVDLLALWTPPPAAGGDLPVLPGVKADERERLAGQAQAALTLPRVIEAVEAGGLGLHVPAEGRLLTAVDQVAVEDLGFAACGAALVQDSLTGQAGVLMIDLDTQAVDASLQGVIDGWLAKGRVKLTDFGLPSADGDEPPGGLPAEDDEPEFARRYRDQLAARAAGKPVTAEVELLRAGTAAGRAQAIAAAARRSALLLYPRLTAGTAGEALRAELQALAARGVLSVVGWGTADDPAQEPAAPEPGAVEALQQLQTPEGLPAVTVWWVGGLYGQDVVLDHEVWMSSVPHTLTVSAQRLSGGASTYVVTAPDLLQAALEDFEPPFARAARLSWHAVAGSARRARQELDRCCLTWLAIRRPAEAFSHLLKLAAQLAENEPEDMLVAWEALTVTLVGLGGLLPGQADPAATAETLRRAIPEFLDWSDSGLVLGGSGQTPFVSALRERLGQQTQWDPNSTESLLDDVRRLWASRGAPAARMPLSAVFTLAADVDPKRERLKAAPPAGKRPATKS